MMRGTVVCIDFMRETEERGRVYGVHYVSENGMPGGSSFSWEEELFSPITCPEKLLAAKVFIHECEAQSFDVKAKEAKNAAAVCREALAAVHEANAAVKRAAI